MRAVEYAEHVGAEVVNGALSAPARYPGHPPGVDSGQRERLAEVPRRE